VRDRSPYVAVAALVTAVAWLASLGLALVLWKLPLTTEGWLAAAAWLPFPAAAVLAPLMPRRASLVTAVRVLCWLFPLGPAGLVVLLVRGPAKRFDMGGMLLPPLLLLAMALAAVVHALFAHAQISDEAE
jgi:hypothetical protein